MHEPTFAETLRRQRDAAGLTQAELAARAGVAVRTVSNLERGINSAPYAITVRLLADALALPDPARADLTASARPTGGAPTSLAPPGSYLGAAPASELIARAPERAALEAAVSAAAAGTGQALLVTGEPGIGKTRLGQEASVLAAEHGFLVATGRCYETSTRTPYAPFLEAMATLYAGSPTQTRTQLAHRWPSVTPLLPDEFPMTPADSSSAPDQAERLHRAVAGFVRELAGHRPVALLFDDLQWADTASLGLLTHLVRHLSGQRALVLGTSRNVGVRPSDSIRELARSLNREGLLTTIVLDRLDYDGITELLTSHLDAAPVSAEFAGLIHRQAQGNPFFTVEILMTLMERGDLSRIDGRWVRRELSELEAPPSINAAINERVARLATPTQEVLHSISVLGEVVHIDDLTAIGTEEAVLEAALDEATAAGLVFVADNNYVFDHVLTHRALYAALSPLRRRNLHRLVGEELELLSEPIRRRRAAEIARHLEAGGVAERSVVHLLAAGDSAAELHAHAEAMLHYKHAAELAEQVGDRDAMADALERTGGLLIAGGRYAEAHAILDRASAAYQESRNLSARLRVEGMVAHAHYGSGSGEAAADRLARVVAEVDRRLSGDGDDHGDGDEAIGLAVLSNGLARVCLALRKHADALDAADRAAHLARKHGAAAVEADAEAIRGTTLCFVDRPDDAIAALERSASLAARENAIGAERDALLGLQWQCTMRGDFRRAQAAAHRGLQLSAQAGDTDSRALQTANIGLTEFYRGDWAAANDYLEQSLRLSGPHPQTLFTGIPSAYMGLLHRGRGALEDAETCYRQASTAPDLLTFGFDAYLDARLAELDLLRGEPAAALDRLARWLPSETTSRPHDVMLLCIAAEACFAIRDHLRGIELANRAVGRAHATRNEVDGIDAHRLRAAGLAHQGRTVEARSLVDEGLKRARALPHPAAEARLHRQIAEVAATDADYRLAHEHFASAEDIFRRLGADHDGAAVASRTEDLRPRLER